MASGKPIAAPGATGPDEAQRTKNGATRHATEARCRPQPGHGDRCQATTATRCRKRGQRAQPGTNHSRGTGARQHPTHITQTPARKGGVQADGAHRHTNPHDPARGGGAQPKPKPKHTHPQSTPQPGVAGYKRGAPINTHTPNIRARSGEAQPKPKPKHTNPHGTPQPGVAGYKQSAFTNTNTHQHPSKELRGAAETRSQADTHTPHTAARSGGVQAGHAHKHTHTPTPQPGVAGRSRDPDPGTHTHTAHPSQEWRGTSWVRTQTHSQPNTPARSGGALPKPKPKHTNPHGTPQPGVAGYKQSAFTNTNTHQPPSKELLGRSRDPIPSRHTHTAHRSQEWRGTSGARPQTHTYPNTPARSGGAQPRPGPRHTHPHRTPQPGVAGYKLGAHTNTLTPQHPS